MFKKFFTKKLNPRRLLSSLLLCAATTLSMTQGWGMEEEKKIGGPQGDPVTKMPLSMEQFRTMETVFWPEPEDYLGKFPFNLKGISIFSIHSREDEEKLKRILDSGLCEAVTLAVYSKEAWTGLTSLEKILKTFQAQPSIKFVNFLLRKQFYLVEDWSTEWYNYSPKQISEIIVKAGKNFKAVGLDLCQETLELLPFLSNLPETAEGFPLKSLHVRTKLSEVNNEKGEQSGGFKPFAEQLEQLLDKTRSWLEDFSCSSGQWDFREARRPCHYLDQVTAERFFKNLGGMQNLRSLALEFDGLKIKESEETSFYRLLSDSLKKLHLKSLSVSLGSPSGNTKDLETLIRSILINQKDLQVFNFCDEWPEGLVGSHCLQVLTDPKIGLRNLQNLRSLDLAVSDQLGNNAVLAKLMGEIEGLQQLRRVQIFSELGTLGPEKMEILGRCLCNLPFLKECGFSNFSPIGGGMRGAFLDKAVKQMPVTRKANALFLKTLEEAFKKDYGTNESLNLHRWEILFYMFFFGGLDF